ncbi:hypothetical protein OVY01_22205 [Robbsia sp. Bb-Pol-6]|uniref:Glycosyl transferase n=1 Tax=Robbsia betulipollinis TaxID=2981849 RepID=A0ABT3ZTS7_9BURK|nr:glycosyltransferase family 9 protein [Robbsia betulipollinis]MCY0389857.1 hypothetical protein [Robbsia betulipollinis]
MRIEPGQRIAFQMSQCLGDSLLAMIVVNNLARNGYAVVVFGDYIHALQPWFSRFVIRPSVQPEDARTVLAAFDVVLHVYPRNVVGDVRAWHPACLVMEEWPNFRQPKNMVALHADLCRRDLGLADVVEDNGWSAPAGSQGRKHARRVILHPTASAKVKMWFPQRFLALAHALRRLGYEPAFTVAPHERGDWLYLEEHGFAVPAFASLSETARWIHESGWFIGNDSGMAHLASNFGIPTLSLTIRKRVAFRWRPGWTLSLAVLPLPLLPARPLKDVFWRHFLPVGRVMKAFARLRQLYADR